jgi:predicted dehydrogenase
VNALEQVRVGMVGSGFMAKTHSLAYRGATMLYGELPTVEQVRIADVVPELAQSAAELYGWAESTTDWERITAAADIDLVDIVTPNFVHAPVAIAAARNGKHVLCEKPLANELEAAREMYRAVRDAGVVSQVGFVFRMWPAMQLAKRLIDEGKIGKVLQIRAHYFHDYALDPEFPVSWRLRKETSGGGSVADLGSHLFDLCRYLIGEVDSVLARSRTIVPQRPGEDGRPEDVDVDDASDVLLEFVDGSTGVIETNWMAAGYKTDLAFEVAGDAGTLRFSWEHNGELQYYSAADPEYAQGFRSIIVGPQHAGADGFWPVPGQGLGYGDAFVILVRSLLGSLGGGATATPSFLDGMRAAEIVAAAQASAASGSWTAVEWMPSDE